MLAAIDRGPEAAMRHVVAGILEFVGSEAYVDVARRLGRVPWCGTRRWLTSPLQRTPRRAAADYVRCWPELRLQVEHDRPLAV